MRAKLLSKTDMPWSKFTDLMNAFGLPYTGISVCMAPVGHSGSDRVNRVFCSCGYDSAENEKVCPHCGGQLLRMDNSHSYYHEVSIKSLAAYKDGDTWNYGILTVSCDRDCVDKEMVRAQLDYKENFTVKDGVISMTAPCKSRDGGRMLLSDKPRQVLKDLVSSHWAPEEETTSWPSLLKTSYIQDLPHVFSEENMKTKPLTMELLLDTLYLINVDSGAVRLADSFSDDLEKLLDELDMPFMVIPFTEQLLQSSELTFNNFFTWRKLISKEQWAELEKTPIFGLLLSRVKHGNMLMSAMVDILCEINDFPSLRRYYYNKITWGDEERALFYSFCKENIDCFSENELTEEFRKRYLWMKKNGVFINEETMRTRNFHKAYNLKNFRKTLKNTDVEELIQSDPLLLLSRIR